MAEPSSMSVVEGSSAFNASSATQSLSRLSLLLLVRLVSWRVRWMRKRRRANEAIHARAQPELRATNSMAPMVVTVGWRAGCSVTKPRLDLSVLHSTPLKPSSHTHAPRELHCPCPEHTRRLTVGRELFASGSPPSTPSSTPPSNPAPTGP